MPRAKGLLPLVRAAEGRRACACRRSRRREHQLAERAFTARGFQRVHPCGASRRLQRRRDLFARRAARSRARDRRRGVRRRRALSRGPFRSVAMVSAYFPSGSSGPARQEAKFRFLAAFDRRLTDARTAHCAVRVLRRLQHGAQGDRSQELARESGLSWLHAAGARLARLAVRRPRVRRRVPRGEPGARSVHVVVESRPRMGEERRVAHRLSGREPRAARGGAAASRSTSASGSPITRRSRSTTTGSFDACRSRTSRRRSWDGARMFLPPFANTRRRRRSLHFSPAFRPAPPTR